MPGFGHHGEGNVWKRTDANKLCPASHRRDGGSTAGECLNPRAAGETLLDASLGNGSAGLDGIGGLW